MAAIADMMPWTIWKTAQQSLRARPLRFLMTKSHAKQMLRKKWHLESSTVPVNIHVPVHYINAMERKLLLSTKQVDEKDATAIAEVILGILENRLYGGIKSRKYD
jgi:hypothetical protein